MIRRALEPKFNRKRFNNYLLMFRYLLMFSKLIGLATFSMRKVDAKRNSNDWDPVIFVTSKSSVLYNAILIVVTISSGYHSLLWRYRFHYASKSSFTQNIDVLQNVLSIIVLSTILTVYCIKQESMVTIGNRLIDVQKIFERFEVSFRPQRIFYQFLSVCILSCALFVAFVVSFTFEYRQHEIISYIVDLILPFVISWLMLQYYLVVSLIDARFVEMNRCLQTLSEACTPECMLQTVYEDQRTVVSGTIVNCLVHIRDIHTRLSQISNDVSDFFSVPILFGLTYTLFCLTYNGYFLVIPLVSSVELSYTFVINTVFCLLCLMFPVIVLTFKITKLMNEFAETGNALHDLLSCEIDRGAKTQLKLFSLQLLHKKIKFTACGFFLLDTTLLQGIIGTVTTYMVILIQLQPGSSDDRCPAMNNTNFKNDSV